ncbi:hypothetical protein [Actinoplanes sp. NPDC049599]|uniref:hypothetical protein n=1 Tax=Actinoplanes sp. NPDC049599 TaxID=3363903 RepID=UPI0037BCA46A
MDDLAVPVIVLAAGLGLWLQYVIIKLAVYQGLLMFLRDAARPLMREGHDVSQLLDQLASHLAGLTRRQPPAD